MKIILFFLFLEIMTCSYVVDMSLASYSKCDSLHSDCIFASLDDGIHFFNENPQIIQATMTLKKTSLSYNLTGSPITFNLTIVSEDKR